MPATRAAKPKAATTTKTKARATARPASRNGKGRAPARPAPASSAAGASLPAQVRETLAALERASTKQDRDNLARFGIVAPRSFGVSMANLKTIAKRLGRSHALAEALWKTGWYEARMLTSFVDEPARVTPAQMNRWCADFDNWAITDTLCFHLFDRTPHAWAAVDRWAAKTGEFQKRAAFALLASLALHDKAAADAPFVKGLRHIEAAAPDARNFVKKGVSWALRSVGRRNAALHASAVDVARRLAASEAPGARWVGKDALRELTSPAMTRKLGARGVRG